MRTMTVGSKTRSPIRLLSSIGPVLLWGTVLLVVFFASFTIYQSWSRRQQVANQMSGPAISVSDLEGQYGIRLYLLAVTAEGGMVDLRLNVVDGQKAAELLQDKSNFPQLILTDPGVILSAVDDSQASNLKTGDTLYAVYVNARNSIKPGAKVTLKFGDIHLEPVVVQ